MKRTVTINLFGTAYTIDEDAHQLLEQYFSNMRSYFSRQAGGEEIADDIEHRVAELFWDIREQGNGWEAISIEQVTEIIQKVGNPEQMTDDNEANLPADQTTSTPNVITGGNKDQRQESEGGKNSEETSHSRKTADTDADSNEGIGGWIKKRRFFRDPQDKRIGGVISGACHYFGGKDPLVWRLVYALVCSLAIFGNWHGIFGFVESIVWWSIVLYLLLWMVAPEAQTAEDRLRMQGKPVNPDSINDELLNTHGIAGNNGNKQTARGSQNILSGFTEIIAICVKALLIIIGVGMVLVFIFPIIVLITVLFNAPFLTNVFEISNPAVIQGVTDEKWMIALMVLALVLLVALPIYALCRWLVKSSKPLAPSISTLLIVLWVLSLGYAAYYTVHSVGRLTAEGNIAGLNPDWFNQAIASYDDDADWVTLETLDHLPEFKAVEIDGVGRVSYTKGNEFSIERSGSEYMVNKTLYKVEDGILKIENKDKDGNHHDQKNVTITITAPTITSAKMCGVGSLELADSIFSSEPVTLSLEGVGSLKAIYIEAPKVEAENRGVGSAEINVNCDELYVNIEGVGSMTIEGETHNYHHTGGTLVSKIKDSGLKITKEQ